MKHSISGVNEKISFHEININNGEESASFYILSKHPLPNNWPSLFDDISKIVTFIKQRKPSFIRIIFQDMLVFEKRHLYNTPLEDPVHRTYDFLLNETKNNILFQDSKYNPFYFVLNFEDLPNLMPLPFFKIKNKEGSTILFNEYDKLNEKYAHQDKEIARYLKYAYKNEFNFDYENPSHTGDGMYKKYLDNDASTIIARYISATQENISYKTQKAIKRDIEKAIKLRSSKYIKAFFEYIKQSSNDTIKKKMQNLLLESIIYNRSVRLYINFVDDDHKTILDYALDLDDLDLIDLLQKKGAKTGIDALISEVPILSEDQKEYLLTIPNLLCNLIQQEQYGLVETLLRKDRALTKNIIGEQGNAALQCAQNRPEPNMALISKLQEEIVYNRSKVKWALRHQKWNLTMAALLAAIIFRKRIISFSTPYASQFWQYIKNR